MTADLELQSPTDAQTIQRRKKTPRTPIKVQIVDYLASNGASKVADISNGIACCRDSVRHHLAALESAAIVRSNIAPGERSRFTPFYALAPERTVSGS
jgi:hypothetical protein